eukprot:gene2248-3036_t
MCINIVSLWGRARCRPPLRPPPPKEPPKVPADALGANEWRDDEWRDA